jgi:hypothetical protein
MAGDDRVDSRSAADVEHDVASPHDVRVEGARYTSERLECFRWHAVEQVAWVAHVFTRCATDGKVKSAPRLHGDRRVHGADRIDNRFTLTG